MSTTSLFVTSAGVGLAIAAPVGPMGMLCIRRTLTGGPRAGLAIGFRWRKSFETVAGKN